MFPLPRGGKWLPILAGLFVSGVTFALVLAVTGTAEPARGWPATVELVNITISPSTSSAPVAVAKPAGGSLPVKPPEHVVATQPQQESVAHPTQASWYASTPPWKCWDGAVEHDVPRTSFFTAMRDVPCGTPVTITGAMGSVQVIVWDHGPNCNCPERELDMSIAAFVRAIGPVSQGVGLATWRMP